ncbi:hypothetical protein [Paraurantiacibacter namhicola]|uniref:Uncharacterized protein n=1 Tax=Paraurantiacibacter namhicola TaxID=645517 RepID=A0A1C7D608_9SPHN|nr:hypothetical protein [Paraurantiacibacter namhicola]ANU06894.1 hypothetical protein A6F65_00571 [Paraurantiacibacter namhicola]
MARALTYARTAASDVTLADLARVAITGGCAMALALAGVLAPTL